MHTNWLKSIVHLAVAATPIPDLLRSKAAIVCERIARGGGATKWYYCSGVPELEVLEAKFTPSSTVSFYFDGRIRDKCYSPEVLAEIEGILGEAGEVVFGTLGKDHTSIDVEIITGSGELAQVARTMRSSSRVFYGKFPARENDGVHAVTLLLPDADGQVRAHPH